MASNQPLRVAILVPSLHGGGAEFVATQWGLYLTAQGDKVTFLTTHDTDESLSKHVGGRWFGERILHLRNIFKGSHYDVILSMGPHWNLIAILARLHLKTGPATVISGRTIEIEANRAGNNKRIELNLARLFYRWANQYIAISHATAAEAQAVFKVQTRNIWVVPNPALGKIDPDTIIQRLSPRENASSEPVSRVLDLVVPGRFTPSKRSELAIEVAMKCAEHTSRQIRLHFFGSGQTEASTKSRPSPNVEMLFHGWVEEWFEHVPRNAVILLTSRIEGFANVLVEAAAMGHPAVASSRALGVSDAIVPGLTGQLALTDSVNDYADAIFDAEKMVLSDNILPWLNRFSLKSSGSKLREVLLQASRRKTA